MRIISCCWVHTRHPCHAGWSSICPLRKHWGGWGKRKTDFCRMGCCAHQVADSFSCASYQYTTSQPQIYSFFACSMKMDLDPLDFLSFSSFYFFFPAFWCMVSFVSKGKGTEEMFWKDRSLVCWLGQLLPCGQLLHSPVSPVLCGWQPSN